MTSQAEGKSQENPQPTGDGSSELPETLDAAQEEIIKLREQINEERNKYLYLFSDFENHRRRAVKERSETIKYGWENVARELLEVIDNIERALDHMPKDTDKALVAGLHMVLNQFKGSLEKFGVKPIAAKDQEFDPNLHEAIGQAPSDKPQGIVVHEESTGYLLHDRLLRASRVIVSSGVSSGVSTGQKPENP